LPALQVSKQTALRIGLQIERLAGALDARDLPTLTAMAARLRATAGEHGITLIADLAGQLEQAAAAGSDRIALVQLTFDLLELCRSTYGSYLPNRAGNDPSPIAGADEVPDESELCILTP
jgi:hypothetical protein